MLPIEVISRNADVALEDGDEALARHRGAGLAVPLIRRFDPGQFQESRHHVDDVGRRVPQCSVGPNHRGPVQDARRRDAAFVDPDLVPSEGGVGTSSPTRGRDTGTIRPSRAAPSGRARLRAPSASHPPRCPKGKRSACCPIRPSCGSVRALCRFPDPCDPPWRRVSPSWSLAGASVLGRQVGPGDGVFDLARADEVRQVRLEITRRELRVPSRQVAVDNACLFHPFPTLFADDIPSLKVPIPIAGNVLRQGVERKNGGR